jgi:hypothetical protein
VICGDLWHCLALSLFFLRFIIHCLLLAKNINKAIELKKYKIYQKAINWLGTRRICCCLDRFWAKACETVERKLEKDENKGRNSKNIEKGNKN